MSRKAFIDERIRIETEAAVLESLPPNELGQRMREIEAAAAAKSSFKLGQIVRVCMSPGFSLVTLSDLPHDHNDPKQHRESRVVGWDCFSRIEIASEIYDNPHCSEWSTTEDRLTPVEGPDWVGWSNCKPGLEFRFKWELEDFGTEIGSEAPGIVQVPHLRLGDWIVLYRKPDGNWITRVLNERQMIFDT